MTIAVRRPVRAVLASVLAGSLLILLAGANPITAYANLLRAGFGCERGGAYCAILSALTFSGPLLLSGLAATVALRAGFFTLGTAGQMLFGAGLAAWIGGHLELPAGLHAGLALAGGAAAGALWSWPAVFLRERIGVNEILVTLLMNPIAGVLLRLVRLPRTAATAQLTPLIEGTKVTAGLVIGALAAIGVYLLLWHTTWGFEQRMAGQAPRFACFGGIRPRRPVVRAVLLSGGLAGLAGAIEVLGVHREFVASFSAGGDFDGLMVAALGQLHPLGVAVFAFLLGGLRAGAITGLQIQSGVPREVGALLIAMMLLLVATRQPGRAPSPSRQPPPPGSAGA